MSPPAAVIVASVMAALLAVMTPVGLEIIVISRLGSETDKSADGTTDQRPADRPLLRRMTAGRKQSEYQYRNSAHANHYRFLYQKVFVTRDITLQPLA